MPSRPVGRLLDLEYEVLQLTIEMSSSNEQVYGFALARRLSSANASSGLIGHGTLYKALSRLSGKGLLEAAWESDSEDSGRPRRRLYVVTVAGELELSARPQSAPAKPLSKPSIA
jgi:DNA-binding PadR family transcriptional regulator